jgi:hypothetical protein
MMWTKEPREQLAMYREYYKKAFFAAQVLEYDSRWTSLSHILGAISVAVDKPLEGSEMLLKRAAVSISLFDYGNSCMEDDVAEKNAVIKAAFHQM